MIIPKLLLIKKKKSLEKMSIEQLQEKLDSENEKLKKIQGLKRLYVGCYIDEDKNIFFTKPLEQKIQLIKRTLHSKLCENEKENCM